ncbi:MAG: DUF3811 domain-containing protein [Hafnia sp.]|jgi:hypothetical protein|uniref:DUF3811 domain-containing protein n=1 Tax=Hafnia sp. TaxID=1873498 RepID=UPI002FC6DC1D
MNKVEHNVELGEYERYVLEALYAKEVQTLGRDLTLGEQRRIRVEYINALRDATPPKKRRGKRPVNVDEEFQWQPSVSMRKIRPRE